MQKHTFAIAALFLILLIALLLANATQSFERIYSTAQYSFTAERTSLFPQTCARFEWAATLYTDVYFNGEPVDGTGEKTVCARGDLKGILTVVYLDGNPLTYALRVPGVLGLFIRSIAAFGLLVALSLAYRAVLKRAATPRLPDPAPDPRPTSGRFAAALVLSLITLLGPLAAIQAVYPAILHDSWRDWALYWLYLTAGVVLPGTLLLLSTVPWKADWLTWAGLGWAVGHGLELVALLAAKAAGQPDLFALWIPLALAVAVWRRDRWVQSVKPLARRRQTGVALAALVLIGTICFVSLNLAELSPRPPYVSDVWFHINNAHEFRDHATTQDPRLAGEPFNYHMFSYAPTAAASLLTGAPVANLLARYVGLSSVWLLTLLLFNAGRAVAKGHPLSGFFAAVLIILPLDVPALLSSGFAFGTFLMFYGAYISTTTLGGYIFLAALLLPLAHTFRQPTAAGLGVIALLTFAGAGAKSMFGPVVLSGMIGLLGWQALIRRRWDRRWWGLLAAVLVPVGAVTAQLVFGANSYSESIRWGYAHFSRLMPYYLVLSAHGWPEFLAATLWPLGFALLFVTGAALAVRRTRPDEPLATLLVFGGLAFAASLVAALAIYLNGASQLFFLYYGLAAVSPAAGYGLARATLALIRRPNATPIAAAVFLLALNFGHFESTSPDRSFGEWINYNQAGFVWRALRWASDAFRTDAQLPREPYLQAASGPLGPYARQLVLTDEIADGLRWAREHLPKDAVFAVNVAEAAAYSGYSERRAFLETTLFSSRRHAAASLDAPLEVFAWRHEIIEEWQAGDANILERMRAAGITHVFVDYVNGEPVAALPADRRIFHNRDFEIYTTAPRVGQEDTAQ